MVLYTEQKRSGGGAAVKTNFLREVLKRLSEEPRDRVPKDDVTAADEALLQVTGKSANDPPLRASFNTKRSNKSVR